MVHVIHTADFHLDPPMTKYLNKDKVRRKDFLKNFNALVDFALKERPDIVLISGDLFDSINPRNPVRKHVIEKLKELFLKQIKILAIGGNHDMPRSTENALSPLSILNTIEYLDFIQPVGQVINSRKINIDNVNLEIFGESYDVLNTGNRDPLDDLRFPDFNADINIFMVHGNIGLFKYRYPGDYIIKEINIPEQIDYVAAGHLHDHLEKTRYNPNLGNSTDLIYPGSIEFLSFREDLEKPKGFMFLEFAKDGLISKDFIKLKTRPLKAKNISINLNDENINQKVLDEIKPLENPELILKIILEGKIRTDQIPSIKTAKLLEFGDDLFFKLFLDNYNKLSFESSELILPDKENAKPKDVFIRFSNNLIQKEKNQKVKERLKKAKEISLRKLEKYGVD
ncbi:MAG: hypothetical protein GF311_08680 [Candidatus Lokiarchaeota archaeon]|nr:hypothetical protein [Candidatus Lokiarchaeota archaeon]